MRTGFRQPSMDTTTVIAVFEDARGQRVEHSITYFGRGDLQSRINWYQSEYGLTLIDTI